MKREIIYKKMAAVFLPPCLYDFLKYFTFRFELTGLAPVVTSTSLLLSRIRQ